MQQLGANISASGGIWNCIKRAEEVGINTFQTMVTAPVRWSTKEIDPEIAKKFVEASLNSSIQSFLLHGIYLVNLARKDKQMFHLSKMSLVTHLNFLSNVAKVSKEMGARIDRLGLVFHPGSAKDLSPEDGIKRVAYGVNWVLEHTSNEMLLLETSAGAGNVMGDTLEELAQMYELVEQKDRVGFVLDTQHMWVSGYNWQTDLNNIIDQVDSILGLQNIKVIHINDSMTDFDSHKDRHANLGEGTIGYETLCSVVKHPKLQHIPFILETPGLKTKLGLIAEIAKLQECGHK